MTVPGAVVAVADETAEAINESYVVRVGGSTRRLGSLSEGDEVPVWYFNGDPGDCTVMPMAVAGRFLRSEIGWAFVLIGGGVLSGMYLVDSFSAGAWFAGAALVVFAVCGRLIAARETMTAPAVSLEPARS